MNTCPTSEHLAALLDNNLSWPLTKKLLSHIMSCPECRSLMAFAVEACAQAKNGALPTLTTEEQAKVTALVNDLLARHNLAQSLMEKAAALLAERLRHLPKAPDEQPEVEAADGSQNKICFESSVPSSSPRYWMAELEMPEYLSGTIRFTIVNAKRTPFPQGVFIFCDVPLTVLDGVAAMPVADFKQALQSRKSTVAFQFPDGEHSEGLPKFI